VSVADSCPDSFDWLSPAHARRVLILGAGRSGHAAQALAVRLGFDPVLLDGDVPLPDGAFAFAVVSPGIAPAHPWRTACAARGLRVMSELAFGVAACRRRGVRLLAVTGSKGKSSVVKAVADALAATGRPALPCGNYGLPVSAVACRDAVAWAVVEVSSFQMETTFLPPDTFEAAVVLNLQEDHLDRHGSVAVYHALKRRLLTMAKETVVADADAFPAGARGGYFDNSVLRANGAAAAGLLQAAGLTAAAAAAALRAFTPLAHRMHPVGVFGGVRCIDDSKATSLAALAAGVDMAGTGVRLVAGGISKGDDPRSVIPLLTERVKKVYLIGQCAESFYAAWAGVVPCEICGTMARAVASAWREAARGDTLLLSPGTASFDQFDSFEHRGDVFAELVKKEGQKRK
jgi:UDP-N-acetylmuramoylalanine--D-glutamate ligase